MAAGLAPSCTIRRIPGVPVPIAGRRGQLRGRNERWPTVTEERKKEALADVEAMQKAVMDAFDPATQMKMWSDEDILRAYWAAEAQFGPSEISPAEFLRSVRSTGKCLCCEECPRCTCHLTLDERIGPEEVFPYVYAWGPRLKKWPATSRLRQLDRKGQRCRVVCRGAMNSALIEFRDGHQAVISRSALRKVAS